MIPTPTMTLLTQTIYILVLMTPHISNIYDNPYEYSDGRNIQNHSDYLQITNDQGYDYLAKHE